MPIRSIGRGSSNQSTASLFVLIFGDRVKTVRTRPFSIDWNFDVAVLAKIKSRNRCCRIKFADACYSAALKNMQASNC